MSKRVIYITSPCRLSLENQQLVIENEEAIVRRSIEDIRMLFIDHHSAHLTVPLLNHLSSNNVGVVVCNETHLPTGILMGLHSNCRTTMFTRGQLQLTEPDRKRIWKRIVEAKIHNQSNLLDKLELDGSVLKPYYCNVKSGDSTNREGIAAKVYWKVLFGRDFVRDRQAPYPNDLLNYGYAVLRTFVTRAIMDAGLLPMIGVFHKNYFDDFPLSDDMMEPFRPFVDSTVYGLVKRGRKKLDKEAKKEVINTFYDIVTYDEICKSAHSLASYCVGESQYICFPELK